MTAATGNLAVLLEGFFTRRLMQQRQASAHCSASTILSCQRQLS